MSACRYGWIALATVVAACEPVNNGPTTPAAQDSAGVRVVEHVHEDAPTFRLGGAPHAHVGLMETEGLTLFRIVGGVLLSSGFVVADGGNHRLVRWSLDGALLGTTGTRGEGPGEFRTVAWIQLVHGSLAVYDAAARRVSWFDTDGAFQRSLQLQMPAPAPRTDDGIVASGGALAVVGSSELIAYPMAYADPAGEAGPLPVHADVAVYDSTSSVVRDVGRFVLVEWYEDPSIDGFPLANRMETPTVHYSGRDELVGIADAVGHRIDVLQAGRRRTVILESRARLPFQPDSIPAEYDVAADSLQAYRDVRVDAERRIWVKPAVLPRQGTTVWRAFSRDGARVGTLSLPSDAIILDATADFILLARRGALDEEFVELWDLIGPGR